jgi:tyrosinase
MRLSFIPAVLAASGAHAIAIERATKTPLAPALPLSAFNTSLITPITLEEAQNGGRSSRISMEPQSESGFTIAATCANPRVRVEWDNLSNGDRQNFINALQCLMNRAPSGQFPQAKSRYEDLVALHQQLTPNVHLNAKFLIWHRYYLWTFEDILRTECGFTSPLPWFDETRYAGRFSQSSIFSNQWFGAIAVGGNCVTNGVSKNHLIFRCEYIER